MFQCKDLTALPSLSKAKILAGSGGLGNGIRWVYKPEDMNFAKWVRGNELLIISTPVIQSKDFDLHKLIEEAVSLHMAGVLLLVGNHYIESIPSEVISYANEKRFPMFSIEGDTPLVDIFEEIGHAIAYDDKTSDDLFSSIVLGNGINADSFALKCGQYGYEITGAQQMFMIHLHSEEFLQKFDYETVSEQIKSGFENVNVKILISRYGSNFVGIFHAKPDIREKTDIFYKDFEKYFSLNYNGWKVSMGIGKVYERLEDLQKSFHEASRCIAVLEKLNKSSGILRFSEMGFLNLILEFEDKKKIDEYIENILGIVIEYDLENHTDFLNTLKEYLWNNNSLLYASEKLHMHRNTVKYRIKRIEEMTGKDFDNSLTRLEFMNAILCMELCR
jgi:sugar diacid utilization regulator